MANGFSLRPKNDRYMKRMLLDRITAPQCPVPESRPRFIEGRVQAPGTAHVLEQPELRAGRQLSEDHSEQAKFRTRVGAEPPREQFRRHPGDRPRLAGRRRDCPLPREGGEVSTPDLHPDAGGPQPTGAQAARRQVREARELAPQLPRVADIVLEGLLGAE